MFIPGATTRALAEVYRCEPKHGSDLLSAAAPSSIDSQLPSNELSGEVEADQSYTGGVRKGKRERGAAGRIAVVGL